MRSNPMSLVVVLCMAFTAAFGADKKPVDGPKASKSGRTIFDLDEDGKLIDFDKLEAGDRQRILTAATAIKKESDAALLKSAAEILDMNPDLQAVESGYFKALRDANEKRVLTYKRILYQSERTKSTKPEKLEFLRARIADLEAANDAELEGETQIPGAKIRIESAMYGGLLLGNQRVAGHDQENNVVWFDATKQAKKFIGDAASIDRLVERKDWVKQLPYSEQTPKLVIRYTIGAKTYVCGTLEGDRIKIP